MVNGEKCAKVIACVNHDPNAIASHAANHPDALHFTEDIRTLELSPLVERFIKANKWNYKVIELPLQVANFNNRGKLRKQEVLVYNYNIQPSLFD